MNQRPQTQTRVTGRGRRIREIEGGRGGNANLVDQMEMARTKAGKVIAIERALIAVPKENARAGLTDVMDANGTVGLTKSIADDPRVNRISQELKS